jgi:O-antigen ligase
MALPVMVLVIALPFVAYWGIPSFKAKFSYVRYDLQTFFQSDNTNGLSDAARILSVKNGLQMGVENFWLGTSAGDLQMEADKFYIGHPDIPPERRLPHNQFIWIFAVTGIMGLILFCWGIFLPLFSRKNYLHPMFACLYIIIVSSFLTEATLEEEIGACFYLVFMLLFYIQLLQNHD